MEERLVTPLANSTGVRKGYRDFQEHLAALEEHGQLIRVRREIDKDSELHPLVRWQFRGGIAEDRRRAFLFENVVDATGHRFEIPVAVGALAANRAIYGMSIGCPLDEVDRTWERALSSPIEPLQVTDAACQDVVITGDELLSAGRGVDAIPVPISTPGWDNAPYTTVSHFITRDPDTGVQNVGNYRAQVKGRARLGMMVLPNFGQGIRTHWEKQRARGEKLPCALVLGCPPAVTLTAVNKVPAELDEVTVAGGLVGAPIRVVRARTVDILVPAESEIVVEGYIDTEYLEPEGPFGESHGYVSLPEYNCWMEVTAITRRRHAVYPSIVSQVTPSESSLIKLVSYETRFLGHLKSIGIHGLERVFLHEALTNLRKVVVLVFEGQAADPMNVWRALHAASAYQLSVGKFVIAVNDDIDPANGDALLWAMSYRMDARHDMQVIGHKPWGHGPAGPSDDGQDGAVLMDATLKKPYPPIALPKREFMERGKAIWEELGLPPLDPQPPWFGYSLGGWDEDLEEQADLAVRGRYWETTEKAARGRRSDVPMNHPIPLRGQQQ